MCSIGQRCEKLKEIEERIEDFISPTHRSQEIVEGQNKSMVRESEEDPGEGTSTGFTPITARTRSKMGPILQAPLRQAMGVT